MECAFFNSPPKFQQRIIVFSHPKLKFNERLHCCLVSPLCAHRENVPQRKDKKVPAPSPTNCAHLQQGGSTSGLELPSQHEICTLSTSKKRYPKPVRGSPIHKLSHSNNSKSKASTSTISSTSPGSNDQLKDCLLWIHYAELVGKKLLAVKVKEFEIRALL